MESRSRRRKDGAESSGTALTICWAVQATVGYSVTLKWRTRRRSCASTTKAKRTRKRTVGTMKKSMETRSRTWLARNVRQVCDGDLRGLGSKRETVRSATSIPSLRSSPWILGAPHKGLVAAIFLMRAAISALIGGRPSRGRSESFVQCSRKRRRCHRSRVSGDTMTRACLQPAQTLASQIQKRRSVGRSLGRAVVLLYTASCCRRARFSTASWRWPPKRNGRSRSTWSKRVIIEPGFSPDQRRQINDLPPAEVLAKDRAPVGA